MTKIPQFDFRRVSSIFKVVFICSLILFLSIDVKSQKKNELDVIKNWIYYSDAPNSLYHHLSGKAYDYLNKRSGKVAAINSLSGWQERQSWLMSTFREVVGPFPEKTPLNTKITKVINKDGYKIENIVFESQPGYFVTSTLFIPETVNKSGKAPAIIYCSGHSNSGYRAYYNVILNLVKKGFIVFAFDPIGQGERLQYFNPETGKSSFKWPAFEHSYAGAQLFITGNTMANYFIWDGIRATDYLLTRKEVDANRLGITGRSGGGTQSAMIAAFDDRIKAVAPENYITNFTRLIQSIGAQDAEQDFMYGIQKGLDMADLLAVRAPKPALMITTTQDMFPIQGAMETALEVSRIYQAYGKPENFTMVTDDAGHTSTKKNREAMYAFFQKHLENPGDRADQQFTALTDDLKVTRTGQVSTSLQSETAFSLNAQDAARRMKVLNTKRTNFPGYFPAMLSSAKRLSGYEEPASVAQPLFTGRHQRDGYVIEKYILKGEGDYVIPYFLLKPEKPTNKAMIYLNPAGKLADVATGSDMEWFAKNGFTVLAPDLIGMGEMGPGAFKGDSYIDSVSFNLWFSTVLINRSITGIQAGDVIRLAKVLKKDNSIKEIYGFAKKQLSPVLLHAAAFDKSINHIALLEPYSSYRSVAMNPYYKADFLASTVPASLGIYDLPDLAASLAPRSLLLINVTDGNGNKDNTDDINKDLSVIKAAYKGDAAQHLDIVSAKSAEAIRDSYKKWIGK